MADTGQITTQAHELIKQYIEYDGIGRPTIVHTARNDAVTGTPSSKVTYTYLSPTSPSVKFMKESLDTWDITWET
jgi:hypothetical protein